VPGGTRTLDPRRRGGGRGLRPQGGHPESRLRLGRRCPGAGDPGLFPLPHLVDAAGKEEDRQDEDAGEGGDLEGLSRKEGLPGAQGGPVALLRPVPGRRRRARRVPAHPHRGRRGRDRRLQVAVGVVVQRLHEIGPGLITRRGVLGQRALDDVVEGRRQLRVQDSRRARLLVEDPVDDGGDRVPGEGTLAGEQLVEHHAQGEEIAAPVHGAPGDLLGRHVIGRADQDARLGQVRLGGLGQPEVGDLQEVPLHEHQVRGLDVPVDDLVPVGVVEGRAGLRQDGEDPVEGEQRRGLGVGLQRLPLDVLHGDVGVILLLHDIVDGDDVGVGQLPGGLGLADEAMTGLPGLLGGDAGGDGDHLDGDLPLDLGVVGQVNNPHGPFADLAEDLETTKRLRGHTAFNALPVRWQVPS